MSEAIGQPGQAALPRPLGIGEILSTAFQLYRRHWRTLLAIAAVVVVPLTLLQYLLGTGSAPVARSPASRRSRPPPGPWGRPGWSPGWPGC